MEWFLLTVELIFVVVGLAGVAMVYIPAALIVASVLGVWSMERALAANEARKLHARVREVAKRRLPGGRAA